ncbi:MAG: hypothetical protein Q8L45_15725 [Xanthomonadaceae bacterium]|nr:hypothetical protein [Xanthomonadaceae bacterium]MDP2186731.1 hypothetical protein [Xanthomonadales bacterium]
MNLDELGQKIRAVSDDPVVQGVANQLRDWKASSDTAHQLSVAMERYIGNVWIGSDSDHAQVYSLWSEFKKDAILGISGMTMNERLYTFSLLDRFDTLQTENDRNAMYLRLHASAA